MHWNLDTQGIEIAQGWIEPDLLDALRETSPEGDAGVRHPLSNWPEGRAGARAVRDRLNATRNADHLLTRSILFDKRPDANWHLHMHRDVTIAVDAKVEAQGFGPWSVKDGQAHVRPPDEVLATMVTARLHLDGAGEDNGCLRVHLGSHLEEVVAPQGDARSPSTGEAVVAAAGDVVLMRPLTLHGSERSRTDARRRVLHLEFATEALPMPVAWRPINLG